MFFSQKPVGYFVEVNSHSTVVAHTSAPGGPMEIDGIKSCRTGDAEGLAALLKELQPKRSPGQNYIKATCGVYPKDRIIRHLALDPKRYKEADYVNEFLTGHVKIDPDKYTLALLNAAQGRDFDFTDTTKKDAVLAGLPNEDVIEIQNGLLASGIYPEKLELGTVATLGALADYHFNNKLKTPTLLLEIDNDVTNSHIVGEAGVESSRLIPQGLDAMIPVVQKEIGLKDAESARKLFFSNTFDFTGMGPTLLKRLLKELQSSIGFYEVQTGQSIGQVICTLLPPKLGWLSNALCTQLGVPELTIDFETWLKAHQVTLAPTVNRQELGNQHLGLLSLLLNYNAVLPEKAS